MSLPYPYLTDNINHINTGSYLDKKESELFVKGFVGDLWYGLSERDTMELSIFDLSENQIGWDTLNTDKRFREVSLSYLDPLDRPIAYSYQELLSDFILYKNSNILVNPVEQVASSFGIISGSYLVSYNFIREMAGTPTEPLVIKDISPSRQEIKIVPLGSNTARYQAFCLKKLLIKDVAPLLIRVTNQCPYSQIYGAVKDDYAPQISFLKSLLFLQTDGAFLEFLKTLYEDVIIYTSPEDTSLGLEKIRRTQGIRSYFQNYLLSNYETISDFITIDDKFGSFTIARIEKQFETYGNQTGKDFLASKQFLIDFFTKNFYHPITITTKTAFESKYYSYFKNALNFGGNNLRTIIDHAYIDERVVETDPLTLLLKLKSELPDDIKIQTNCWISNVSMAPYVSNIIFNSETSPRTFKISAPNFSFEAENISLYNVNAQYTSADLAETPTNQQNIDVNKKINELYVDYTDFTNFIVFSSAQQRITNFKTKITNWTMLSSSLVTLNNNASQSNMVGSTYPYYETEKGSIEGQMNEIVESFDGYESYLFRSGSYEFNPTSKVFVSASYVADQDTEALYYDKKNRDSLISNTPQHIVLDENNDDYLTFLMMTGHFFDNLYLYITNLPSEKIIDNDPTKTFSKKVVDYMLDSFGWKLGNTYEDSSAIDVYTAHSGSEVSAEDRSKAINTRILTTLPQIYKTKGTEEAVRLLLACHGIPSDLLNIREYGGDDYSTGSLVTFTQKGKACLFGFTGSYGGLSISPSIFLSQEYTLSPSVKTVEFKGSFEFADIYPPHTKFPLVRQDYTYKVLWDINNNYSGSSSYPTIHSDAISRGYWTSMVKESWRIGAWREYGKMGRIYAKLGSGSVSQNPSSIYLTSSLFPIFDGDIFNVMLRRRNPNDSYQYNSNLEMIPTHYDLVVQRNEGGRVVWRSEDTLLGHWNDNQIWDGISADTTFDKPGSFSAFEGCNIYWGVSDFSSTGPLYKVDMGLGNMMVWDVPISNADFNLHCNDFNSFAYSGSDAEKHLISRMDVEEPYNIITEVVQGSYIGGPSEGAGYVQNKSEYYSTFYEVFGDGSGTGYTDSGSFKGSKTGSLNTIETLSGSMSGSITGSISGSGYGKFSSEPVNNLQSSYLRGNISGSMSGSFNGSVYGKITSSKYYVEGILDGRRTGSVASIFRNYYYENITGSAPGLTFLLTGSFFGYAEWSSINIYPSASFTASYFSGSINGGSIVETNYIGYSGSVIGYISGSVTNGVLNNVYGNIYSTTGTVRGNVNLQTTPGVFSGSFSGSASGSFTGEMSGTMTSVTFGSFSGFKTTPFIGTLTGSVSGSVLADYMTGSFNGRSSGSVTSSAILPVSSFVGSYDQDWFGVLSGSSSGSFTGSTGMVTWWGGNRPTYFIFGGLSSVYTGSLLGSAESTNVALLGITTYATGSFSGSFIQPWTGSVSETYNRDPLPYLFAFYCYPFEPYNPVYTEDVYGPCYPLYDDTSSKHPYQFIVKNVDKTFSTSQYGPNRYKNEKVKQKSQSIKARLDNKDRSTSDESQGIPSDSNLLGLYLDPQDAKNKDIIRFLGNHDVMDLIADPLNQFSPSYSALQTENNEYNSFGNRRVLYNELITLYKIYFNRSVFDSVKNILPARASVRTGILVEPTVLERPKYQHRPVFSEIDTGSVAYYETTAAHYFHDPATKIMKFSGSSGTFDNGSSGQLTLIYGEFNTAGVSSMSLDYSTVPSNLTIDLDVSYINESNFSYPINYIGGYYSDVMDKWQLGSFASLNGGFGYTGTFGNIRTEPHSNASFLVKQWNKYTVYSKSGSYKRDSVKSQDVYVSSSVWLYKLVEMSDAGYNKLFYTREFFEPSGSPYALTDIGDVEYVAGVPFYKHRVNTAIRTPNQKSNVIKGTENHSFGVVTVNSPYYTIAEDTYFEVFGGYPRNHYTHTRMQFSPVRIRSTDGKANDLTIQTHVRNSQSDTTTIGVDGLLDGSSPIQSIETSNVNLVQSDNVINQ